MTAQWTKVAATAAIGLIVGGGASLVIGAGASASDDWTAGLVAQSQVQEAWSDAVGATTLELPAGEFYPAEAPAFFDGVPGEVAYYEAGLFDSILHHYWRCSWLSQSVAEDAGPHRLADAARQLSLGRDELGAPDEDEYTLFRKGLQADAARMETTVNELEFEIDCEGVQW